MEEHHLTPAHFHAFGYIVSTYAKVEQGFKILISEMLDIDIYIAAILCEPYTTLQLRNVMNSLNKHYTLPNDCNKRLCDLIGEFKTFSRLRNDIGHSMWTDGTRDKSVKPINLDIRSGKAKVLGISDDEHDWTIEELDAEAIRLNALHNRLSSLMEDLGITDDIEA